MIHGLLVKAPGLRITFVIVLRSYVTHSIFHRFVTGVEETIELMPDGNDRMNQYQSNPSQLPSPAQKQPMCPIVSAGRRSFLFVVDLLDVGGQGKN